MAGGGGVIPPQQGTLQLGPVGVGIGAARLGRVLQIPSQIMELQGFEQVGQLPAQNRGLVGGQG